MDKGEISGMNIFIIALSVIVIAMIGVTVSVIYGIYHEGENKDDFSGNVDRLSQTIGYNLSSGSGCWKNEVGCVSPPTSFMDNLVSEVKSIFGYVIKNFLD